MIRTKMGALALIIVMNTAASAVLAADASLKEVYQAATAGRLDEAQSMMTQVLRDHPNSAKAHFVDAEILARQGQMGEAAEQLKTAEQLSPGLSFAKPASVRALEERLGASHSATTPAIPAISQAAHHTSLMSVVLVAAGLLFLMVIISRAMRRPATVGGGVVQSPYGSVNNAPMGAPMGAPMSSGGSGILGSLATGAALGAGMVAGESLMHRMFDGRRDEGNQLISDESMRPGVDNYNDPDFGVADNGSWDDSSIASSDDWS